jgi:hypothetical protein
VELPASDKDFLLCPIDIGEDPVCLACGTQMMVAAPTPSQTSSAFAIRTAGARRSISWKMADYRVNAHHRIVYSGAGCREAIAPSAEVFLNGVFLNAKTDAEAMFKKSKPAPESRLDEEARRIENMTRLRNLRLAREKADCDKDQAD